MKEYYKEAFDFIYTVHPLSDALFKELYESANLKVLQPNEKLLKHGVISNKIYFIAKGVIKAYLVLDSGKEITTALHYPFMFFTSFRALLKNERTSIIYKALTECHVFEVDFNGFYELCKKNTELMIMYSKFLETIILKKEARFIELSSKNATERYLALRERIPNLDNTIPQYEIAGSLGITPVQLSRIRGKLNSLVLIS